MDGVMERPDPPPDLRWSVLRDGALPGDVNMARDHALALSSAPGTAVLRLYRWASPTLSLGRHEPASERFDPLTLSEAGVEVVRRPTGGRTVLHHRELTYAAVMPVRALGGVREAYRTINRALRRGLASLGVAAEIAPERRGAGSPGPGAGPCFDGPAPGEVTAGGRKLVGSAQARIGGALLQHGSILMADDQGLIDDLAVRGRSGTGGHARGGGPPPATLTELLGPRLPGWDALEDAVAEGFRRELGGAWTDAEPALDAADVSRLTTKYGSRGWTWRC